MPHTVILITGLPASGKTSIGKELAARLSVPFVSKDGLKELLFDGLGWKDREWSKKLGLTSYDLLYHFVEVLLKAGTPCIVESNFKREFDSSKFSALKEKYNFDILQILCKADGAVLFDRFKQRSESGQRHPGHVDATNIDEFKSALQCGRCEPLDLQGDMIEVDTTDFEKVDIDSIIASLRRFP